MATTSRKRLRPPVPRRAVTRPILPQDIALGAEAATAAPMNASADATAQPVDAIAVAHVLGAWGVKGAIKVAPQSSDAAALRRATRWWFSRPTASRERPSTFCHDVASVRVQGDAVVATLDGVVDRDLAESLAGCTILVPRSSFPKAGKDEFYWVDLIGCEVWNREGAHLGRVEGLIDTGVHSVLRVLPTPIQTSATASVAGEQAEGERLIPFVQAYVDRVDTVARRILVDWGLDY